MALYGDLITTARQLAHVYQHRPRQADPCRWISTAYYAVFHGLAEVAATRLIGTTGAKYTRMDTRLPGTEPSDEQESLRP